MLPGAGLVGGDGRVLKGKQGVEKDGEGLETRALQPRARDQWTIEGYGGLAGQHVVSGVRSRRWVGAGWRAVLWGAVRCGEAGCGAVWRGVVEHGVVLCDVLSCTKLALADLSWGEVR